MAVKVSLYLDKRKIEEGEKAPLKLPLYISRTDIRHYHTNRYITVEQFNESYLTDKPKRIYRELKIELDGIVAKANMIIKKMDEVFVLEKFEREMFRAQSSTTHVGILYGEYIKELERNDRSGTASNYRLSLKSLLLFAGSDNKPAVHLAFSRITTDFLNRYETWMVKDNKS